MNLILQKDGNCYGSIYFCYSLDAHTKNEADDLITIPEEM